MKKEKTATNAQLRKIFALSKEHGLDDELLHAHVMSVVKKDSIRDLSVSEAIKLIDSLDGKPSGSRGTDSASYKQISYIHGLMKKMGWTAADGSLDFDRLDRFLQNRFQIGSHKWLDKNSASKLIEAFKEMSERPSKEAMA